MKLKTSLMGALNLIQGGTEMAIKGLTFAVVREALDEALESNDWVIIEDCRNEEPVDLNAVYIDRSQKDYLVGYITSCIRQAIEKAKEEK